MDPFQSSTILQSGRLPRVQLILPRNRAIICRRGTQPLSTESQDIGGCPLITLTPFRSSLPGTPSAPARTLNRAAHQMALFPNGRVPLVRQIPEGPLKTYWFRSCGPLLDRQRHAMHRVASAHGRMSTRPSTYLGVVDTGCVVSAKEKNPRLAMEK